MKFFLLLIICVALGSFCGCTSFREYNYKFGENYNNIDKVVFIDDLQDFAYENDLDCSVGYTKQEDELAKTLNVYMRGKTHKALYMNFNITNGKIYVSTWGNRNEYEQNTLNNLKNFIDGLKISYDEKFKSWWRPDLR